MSPRSLSQPPSATALAAARAFWVSFGGQVRDARIERRWSTQQLADRAGVSRALVYLAERGEPISIEAASRLAAALGRRLEVELTDPRRRERPAVRSDAVHSAMGELEAGHLRRLGRPVALDEPYQHFQFAGRADLVSWDPEARALLHIENRTRFPDLQEAAGSYNAKRAYLASSLGTRLGVSKWRHQSHVIAALWTSEVLHALRLRTESFRALCPDPADDFTAWWTGQTPGGTVQTSALVLLDPLAVGRQRAFVSLEDALTVRPRHAGYATVAARLAANDG